MIDLQKAMVELQQKTYAQIQEETAWTWASRACVSYQGSLVAELPQKLVLFALGEEYFHEAVEHAALNVSTPNLLQQVRDAVHPFQENASHAMGLPRQA